MKITLQQAALAAMLSLGATAASAGPIEQACNRSNRDAANPPVCNCIQQAADATLRGSDQRRAAQLINDPDKAHKTWLSENNRDDAFWERYQQFGALAEQYCSAQS
jgi:hypothetical protein